MRQQWAAFEIHFRDHGDRIADRERLQRLANGTLSWKLSGYASGAFERGDLSSCQELLDFALDINPELRNRPEYARLRWKRRVGPKVWSALRPINYVRNRLRAKSASPVLGQPLSIGGTGDRATLRPPEARRG